MYVEFAAVLVFMMLGVAFVVGSIIFGWVVRPSKPGPQKLAIYECGEPTIGSAWIRYNSRFYTVALVYLLFDVEVVVLVPAALVLKELAGVGYGVSALAGLFVFLIVLALGLAYEWYYGNLNWINEPLSSLVFSKPGVDMEAGRGFGQGVATPCLGEAAPLQKDVANG